MQPTHIKVDSLEDVVKLEQIPLEEQLPFSTTYELLNWAANTYGPREAIRFLPNLSGEALTQRYSYTELFERVTQAANLFSGLADARPVVSYLLPNLPQTHFTIWGAEAAGIVNALNPLLEPDKIIALMNSASSNLLVTLGPNLSKDLWEKTCLIADQVDSLKHILVIETNTDISALADATGLPVVDFDRALEQQSGSKLVHASAPRPEDIASYFHTGGTTGTPKIAQHTHFNEVANAWCCSRFMSREAGGVCIVGLPLFHVNAVIGTGLNLFISGHTAVLATPSGYRTPGLIAQFWKLIEEQRASMFSCVPTVLTALLDVPMGDADISSLDFVISGAAPLSVQLMQRFEKTTGAKILESYGLTEAGCVTTMNPPNGERRVGSIGIRMPHQQLRIVKLTERGAIEREAASNESGTLLIKGPNVFPGYLQANKNHGVLLDDGWLNTGDLARIDAQGYVWLTGREKDLIIRGGHNIDPSMVEETLMQHPAVGNAAAVGQPDSYAGELPCASVTLNPSMNVTGEELIAHARAHISERAACPVHIDILPELPLTAVGKVFKPALRLTAIVRVLQTQLEEVDRTIQVTAQQHDTLGTLVSITSELSSESVNKLMAPYSLNYQVLTNSKDDLAG